MKRMLSISIALSLCISAPVFSDEKVAYPKDYRDWTHVKTLTLHEGHPLEKPFKGIHHIYANKKGVEGIKSAEFKDGAVIVFDLLESITLDNASAEGKRVLIGVMVKDKKHFAQTGGWGFEAWTEGNRDKRLVNDGGRSCFECHTSQKDNDYVFSQWRD